MAEYAELLSPAVNFAIVQLPGRRFPGAVIQGDTLNELVKNLERMSVLLQSNEASELSDAIELVSGQLSEVRNSYESICTARGIELPWTKSSS
jgi:hypothetical protein